MVEAPRFVLFEPFGSSAPFETWIMPRQTQPSFRDATDADVDALAPVLRAVLASLAEAQGDTDYNAILQSAPVGDEHRKYFVSHLRIVPRLAIAAAFELGSGMPVNPSRPEDTAATLRPFVRRELQS